MVCEAGVSQPTQNLLDIRDNVLGWKSQVNVFLLAVYNENMYSTSDSWWMQLAFRNIQALAPAANAADNYPPCIIAAELPVINGRYPLVDTPLPPNTIWQIPTTLVYHPQPVPVLVPPMPATVDINLEHYRQMIIQTR